MWRAHNLKLLPTTAGLSDGNEVTSEKSEIKQNLEQINELVIRSLICIISSAKANAAFGCTTHRYRIVIAV